jgi:hypothetical protein
MRFVALVVAYQRDERHKAVSPQHTPQPPEEDSILNITHKTIKQLNNSPIKQLNNSPIKHSTLHTKQS